MGKDNSEQNERFHYELNEDEVDIIHENSHFNLNSKCQSIWDGLTFNDEGYPESVSEVDTKGFCI